MPKKKKSDQQAAVSTGVPATGDLLFHHVVHQAELIERAHKGKDTVALDEAVAKLGTVMQRTRLSARPTSRKRANSPRKREPSEDVRWQGIRASCEDYLSDVRKRADPANRDKHVADLMRLVRPQRSPARAKPRSSPRAAPATVRPAKRLASGDATGASAATKPKGRTTEAQGGRKKKAHPAQTQ